MMKAALSELMQRIPGKASAEWPSGEPFTLAFAHGTMSVEVYAPKDTIKKLEGYELKGGLKCAHLLRSCDKARGGFHDTPGQPARP